MIAPRPLPGVLMILAAGIGLGFGYNALRPQPLPWVAKPLPDMRSLDDSTGTSSDSTSESLAHPQVVELEKDSTRVDRQHITTMPVAPPIGAIDSSTHPAPTTPAPSSSETTYATSTPPVETKPTPPAGNAFSDIPESEDPIRVSLAQTKKFFDRGGVLILDARDPEEYAEGHISGALSAPTDSKMGDIEWLQTMSKDPRPIICYCGGGDCELSIELATELTRTGHRRVLVFEEGFPAWQGAGYPVQEGTAP